MTRLRYFSPDEIGTQFTMLKESAAKSHPLVLMKSGDAEPPVFVAPGLGGNVMQMAQIVSQIQTAHPIYGLEAWRGVDGTEGTELIEDQARFFFEAIRQMQP